MVTNSKAFPARLGLGVQPLPRDEFFAGLCILSCANGLGFEIIKSIHSNGWQGALSNTFGTSGVVWIACLFGVTFLLKNRIEKVQTRDLGVGAVLLSLVILPIGGASWVALTALCLYMLIFY
jgi:hypothetical protein